MKRHLIIAVLLALCARVFCYDGVFFTENRLYVLKTQWFDIIYPKASQDSAFILYEKADSIYQEVAESYGVTPQFRMPVVLTPFVENSNAYWSSYPYNHIVIYDTGEVESMNVFSESLLSTFRHELTHGVSYNSRSKQLAAIDKIFGDPANPVQLTITKGWAEGATLTSESSFGEGRLNDEFSLHPVKQAKIQGEFPEYSDIQGASDLYPIGSFYIFNGAFNQWLQNEYGMEKYAEFWYACVNLKALTVRGAFKKIYDSKLDEEWENFHKSLKIPELLEIDSQDLVNNSSGSVFSDLTAGKNGIAFIDQKTNYVYFIPENKLNHKNENPQKLFFSNELNGIKISQDGRFIAVDTLTENKAVQKKSVKIYSIQGNNWFSIKETGLKESAILQKDNDYYLICQKFFSQKMALKIFKLSYNQKTMNFSQAEEILTLNFPAETIPYSFVDLGNGNFAYIKKSGLKYSICISDINGNLLAELAAPKERMVIRNLFYNNSEILFSWTEPSSLPRLGKLKLNSSTEFTTDSKLEFQLQTKDFSGGVFWPIQLEDKIFYISSFFRYNKLLALNSSLNFETIPGEFLKNNTENSFFEETKIIPEASLYNPLEFYTKGVLIPISLLSTNSYNPTAQISYNLPIGVTYISSNPWTQGLIQLSLGYGLIPDSVGLGFNYSTGTDTDIFSCSFSAQSEFDDYFWKSVDATLSAGTAVPLGIHSYLGISNSILAHYGRSNKKVDNFFFVSSEKSDLDFSKYLYMEDSFSIRFSNIHKTGPGRYEKSGFKTSLAVYYQNNSKIQKDYENYYDGGNAGISTVFYIPKLLPKESEFRFTTNFPTKITANLFSKTKKQFSAIEGELQIDITDINIGMLPKHDAASINLETILFGYEIQNSWPSIPGIFLNDFYVSFIYEGGFSCSEEMKKQKWRIFHLKDFGSKVKQGELSYSHYFSLKGMLALTPNFGGLASYYNKMNLYSQIIYDPESQFLFDFGIDVNF